MTISASYTTPWDSITCAGTAAATAIATWRAVSADAEGLEAGADVRSAPLSSEDPPQSIAIATRIFLNLRSGNPATWDFRRRWWEGARDGRPLDWELQRRVALIPPEEWEKNDPARIAELIRETEAELARPTPLSQAAPVDFSFDALARVMRMVGLDDDTAHLREPRVVQRFLDDCEQLRDTLSNFIDDPRELAGTPNRAGVLRRAAEKVLAELDRTREGLHLRARYLVKLGHELELFSKEEGAGADLGPALATILDNGIALLRSVTRRHFGPSYAALAPLAQLTLDHIDQDAALALMDEMIDRLEAITGPELIALDPEGQAVFRDMVREAQEIRASLAEASSDSFRDLLRGRMAESLGGTGLAFGRYLERSVRAAGTADRLTDQAVKQYRKVQSLGDILRFIGDFFTGGGGAVG